MNGGAAVNRNRILCALIFAVLTFAVTFSDVLGAAENYAEDVLYCHPDGASEKIKIIKIDEKTMNALGDYSQWDRGVYAELIQTLCVSEDIRPAVVGFDILFSDSDGGEADSDFAAECESFGNAVCAFSYVFEKDLVYDRNGELSVTSLKAVDKVVPYFALDEVTLGGFANALTDSDDGVIRKSFLKMEDGGTEEYSFGAVVYERYSELNGFSAEYPATDMNNAFSFRYSSEPSGYENVSLCDVLDGTVPPEAFDDCIVLVGAYAAGMMDAYSVPVSKGSQMYGVEIHANIIQAMLEGKYLISAPRWADSLLCGILAGVLAFVCYALTTGRATAVCMCSAIAKLLAGYVLYGFGISSDVLVFPMFCVIILGFFTAMHYYTANRSRKEIENAFKKYVAPQVVDEIAKSGSYQLMLGGECRDVAVLFVDIRGFTSLSESLQPTQVVEILNSYLELVTETIFRYGGTLDKFIGDSAMAVFNAPFNTEDYVMKAVKAAYDIVNGGEKINEEFREKFGKDVGFGVGVNCGPAVVGNIGCSFRMDYTAIGDTVNVAARLEAAAPSAAIYISKEVLDRISGRVTAEFVGDVSLKGKSHKVTVYSVKDVEKDN